MMTLDHAGWSLSLRPELGGAIAALRYAGSDVLRPTAAGAGDPLQTSCFALVPYANRIADGRFAFDGEAHRLPHNAEGQAHPLHGVGWKRGWDIAAEDATSVTLAHAHAADADWPWSYHAEQRFTLSLAGLRIDLQVTSDDARPMPVGLGFHPYFPATAETRLRFAADSVWLADADMLPTEPAAAAHFADWSAGAAVQREALIDNCYAGWSGSARIDTGAATLRIRAENVSFLHLFVPPGRDFFCVEPVGTMPDALNRAPPATVLARGESHAIAMTLTRD